MPGLASSGHTPVWLFSSDHGTVVLRSSEKKILSSRSLTLCLKSWQLVQPEGGVLSDTGPGITSLFSRLEVRALTA